MTDETGRIICTSEQPSLNEKGKRYAHPDAKSTGECSEGCCDDYTCPNCGLSFRVESPQ